MTSFSSSDATPRSLISPQPAAVHVVPKYYYQQLKHVYISKLSKDLNCVPSLKIVFELLKLKNETHFYHLKIINYM